MPEKSATSVGLPGLMKFVRSVFPSSTASQMRSNPMTNSSGRNVSTAVDTGPRILISTFFFIVVKKCVKLLTSSPVVLSDWIIAMCDGTPFPVLPSGQGEFERFECSIVFSVGKGSHTLGDRSV